MWCQCDIPMVYIFTIIFVSNLVSNLRKNCCVLHGTTYSGLLKVSLLTLMSFTEGLTIVNFLQPLNSLFEKDEVDSVQCLFWPDMDKHREYAKIDYLPNLHKDGILGLKYLAKNRTVITISRDPHASLVIRSIKGKFDSYNFKLGWGVRFFDHVSVPR